MKFTFKEKELKVMKTVINKIISVVLLSVLMVALLPVYVLSADTSGFEDAILTAKAKISVPDYLTLFDSDISTMDGRTEYYLRWYNNDQGCELSITINDRGDIIRYSSNNYGENTDAPKFAVFTKQELAEKSLDWLKSVNPGWASDYSMDYADISGTSNVYGGIEYLGFDRYVNGIRFLNDNISFNVNNITGEIIYMNANHTYADNIPSADGILSVDEAAEAYFTQSPLELMYRTFADDNAVLVYNLKYPQIRLNAKDGSVVKASRSYKGVNGTVTEDSAAPESAGGSGNKFTESELKNLTEVEGLLSEQELISMAKALSHTGLDAASFESCSYTQENIYVYTDSESVEDASKYIASLSFIFNKGMDNEYRGYVTFDAQTGALISYSAYNYHIYYRDDTKKEPTVAKEDALEAAKKFIKENNPDKLSKVITPEPSYIYTDNMYMLNFSRQENNIPFNENYININTDSETGLITGYNTYWNDDITFESPEGILDMGSAKEKFKENAGFKLLYSYSYKDDNDTEPNIVLAYGSAYPYESTIYAKSGEKVSSHQDDNTIIYPTDISDHYAKDRINALVAAGIINIDAQNTHFRPDDAITYRELAAMTARLTRRYYIWGLSVITAFVKNNNIIKEGEVFEPDKTAIRADGPVYIISALGHREVAQLSDIYKVGFADAEQITADKLGFVAIAKGMGLVNGDENGCFNPNAPLTRADAAIMIYNYLAR